MTEQEKLQNFLTKLNKVKKTGPDQWKARCPNHDDQVESLSVSRGDNKINFFCHTGNCSGDDILQAMGLDWSDIYFDDQKKKKRKIVATYDYNNKNGDLLFQVVRFKPKTFRQRRPDDQGGWNWGLGDIKPVLYRLPEVIEAVQNNDIVWLVEGEKDADNLSKMGLITTCNPMGAGKWKDRYTKILAGGKVIILPDADKAGKKHSESVARELHGQAKVKILELPGLDKKQDVTDWINNGGTKKQLLKLAKDCPTFKPDSQQGEEQAHFEEFLPSPIAEEIIKQEKAKGRLWKYVAEKDLFYFYYTKDGYWKQQEPQYLKKFVRQHLRQFKEKWDTKYRVNEVIAAMKSLLLEPENKKLFDAGQDPDLQHINLKNGMLNWRTGKLKPHRPEYYSQFQLPVKYNPEADCPRWKKVLREWKPEKEARMVLAEFVGYCLIPDTSMQKAIILTGAGSNGKSTFLDILVELFGRSNLSSIPLQRLADRFETANIQDKLINVAADIDPTYMKETGIVKTIIGGDQTLRGERKFGASFDFTPVARLIFSANEIPKTRDKTEAWYRRFEIIEFPNTFKKTDPNFDPDLKDKLKKELPGILNWAIKGLKRVKDQKHFTQSESIQEAKREYERENDTVIAFIEDMTEYPEDNYEVGKLVYEEYQRYCEDAGLKYTSRRTFTSKLKKLGFEVKVKWREGKNRRCYYGLKLIS